MRATWHIVRKDLRRMAGPVALWLGFVLVASVWFRLQPFAFTGDAGGGASLILVSTCGLVVIVQLLGLYVLAGALVMEDPMVSSTAFWQTRPISRQRLLCAKLLAAGVLFIAFPVPGFAGVLLGCGADVQQVVVAAAGCALLHGAVLIGAIAVASISSSLLQFLPWTLGFAVAWWGLVGWTESVLRARHVADAYPNAIMGQILPACLVALLATRFTTRRPEWAVAAFATVLALGAAIRIAHPYVTQSRGVPASAMAAVIPNRVTRTEAKPVPVVSIFGTSPRDAKGAYRVPTQAWVAETSTDHSTGVFSLDDRGLARTLALNLGVPAVEWRLAAHGPSAAPRLTDRLPPLAGAWTSVAIAGEAPFQAGQTIAIGASRVVIREIVRSGSGDCGVLLEQRDVATGRLGGVGEVVTDEFVVVDRARGWAHVLDVLHLERGWLDWQEIKILRFNLPAVLLSASGSDVRIVQVRFRGVEPLARMNSVGGAE